MPERMTDERNFRSSYLEKLGCRSVDERKNLEILLYKENPVNKMKLKEFCLRFVIPADYRKNLWKLLLGVTPLYSANLDFVLEQLSAIYQDLLKALQIMRITTDRDGGGTNVAMSKSKIFYAMFLLENKQLHLNFNLNHPNSFTKIADTILEIDGFDNDVESYFLTKGFYELTKAITSELPALINLTQITLEKEDNETYKHICAIGANNRLPYETWYQSCFSGVISERALARIWDRICGGSIKIVVFVLVIILITYKRSVLQMKEVQEVVRMVEQLKDDPDASELIVSKAIEFWQLNKGHTEFSSKGKAIN
ncbi:TBC1 domain family member 7 [Culicoides brevitarsis]|uniref:TBC1 domain family member 7 n=1 Tax=Culicoides brevitarsis TaxID=469753 RepID=UPI00307BD166